jgi:PAS domain S-box-containing protein
MDTSVICVVGLDGPTARVFAAVPNTSCRTFERAADLTAETCDVIVVSLAELDGVRAVTCHVPIIGVVMDDQAAARAEGADQLLLSPVGPNHALAAIRAACEDGRRRRLALAMQAALELVSDSVEVTAPDARMQFVNAAFERMTQYTREEALGKTPAELLRSNVHSPAFYQDMWQTVSARRVWKGSLLGKRKDGAPVAQLAAVQPIVVCGETRHMIAVKQYVNGDELASGADLGDDPDVLRAAVAGFVHAERRYRCMMHAASDAILVHDHETALVLEANPAAERMLGYTSEELRRMTGRQLTSPDAGETVSRISRELNETGRAMEHRLRMRKKDGSEIWASLRCSTYEFLGRKQYIAVLHEVTALVEHEQQLELSNSRLREAQHQLLHSARLAAIGQMAAGVAHEINNPLQCILMGLDEFQRIRSDGSECKLHEAAVDMREAVTRIRSLTRSLLPFARSEREGPQLTDIDEIVQRGARMLQNEIRHKAKLELSLSKPRQIACFPMRMSQLLTNLITNAVQSMEEGSPDVNTLTLATREIGDSIEIRVQDTGSGMSDEVRSKVFEPFFTTKPAGVGTGLGLALCADIVQTHAGSISVTSEVGQGTCFVVRLPFDNGLCSERPACVKAAAVQPGRVLLIDDDPLVLRSLARNLKSRYSVVTAESGKRGVEILASDREFDVVVCDLMMPGLDGPAVYAELETISPELPGRVIFCSGGVFSKRVRDFLAQVKNPIIAKPASLDQLAEAIACLPRAG